MDYFQAAQPRIVALFLVTVLAAMLLAGTPGASLAVAVLVATGLTVAGAAMLNNVVERELDARMERTRRRPTASGRIRPGRALVAGLVLVAAGSLALWATAGGLAAVFALLGAAYYVVAYTLLIKPRTALSSIPGAAAGVFPALVGWAATGEAWTGGLLFLCALVFVWSPPHFWALALAKEEDYRASGIPTPAVAYGDAVCRRLIAWFVAAVTVVTLVPVVAGSFAAVYVVVALVADVVLWGFTARLLRRRDGAAAWGLFKVSGPYLAALVVAAVAGHLL
jgi:heme o synthase